MKVARAPELTEREWSDNFGRHWSVRTIGLDGLLHEITLTEGRGINPSREDARASVLRAAAEGRKT